MPGTQAHKTEIYLCYLSNTSPLHAPYQPRNRDHYINNRLQLKKLQLSEECLGRPGFNRRDETRALGKREPSGNYQYTKY